MDYSPQDKLNEEIKELKHRNHWFNKKIVPLWTGIITIGLGFISFWLPFQLQKNNQENETFLRLIEQATTADSAEGRIAGIWMLDSYWDKDVSDNSNIHKLIANALSGILMSEEQPLVRLAAAEVIGNAYEETDWNTGKNKEKLEALRLLLYGDANTGKYGTLTSANWWLSKDCIKQAENDDTKKLCQEKLFATKEAIRKNWENLENTHLGETDLSKARLYEANLSGANLYKANLQDALLKDANLSRANLINADLSRADLRGVNWKEALYNENTKFPPDTQLPDTMNKIEPGSQLNNKDLSRLPLQGANLSGANLSGANLSRANLSGANLDGANLKDTKYDEKTTFSNSFDPEVLGMIKIK